MSFLMYSMSSWVASVSSITTTGSPVMWSRRNTMIMTHLSRTIAWIKRFTTYPAIESPNGRRFANASGQDGIHTRARPELRLEPKI